MMYTINEAYSELKKYRTGVVITKKIDSATVCIDFDESADSDSEWFGKARLHSSSPYISSITEIINNIPDEYERVKDLQYMPKATGLPHTPNTQYFMKKDHLIMIFHKNRVTSYPYIERAAKKLGVSLAPLLFKGNLESEEHLKSLISEFKTSETKSSIVVRALGSFRIDEYNSHIFEF